MSDDTCDGCTRRTMLQMVAASTLIPLGCRSDSPDPGVDAGGGSDDPGVQVCGNDICLDLTQPSNAALLAPGGSRLVTVPGDKVLVIRLTDTTFNTTSAVCTHQRCSVVHDKTRNDLRCPCHGSRFTLEGDATQGPAVASLDVYEHTFDAAASLLTLKFGV